MNEKLKKKTLRRAILAEWLDQLKVGQSYTNVSRTPLEKGLDYQSMVRMRKKAEYLRTTCRSRSQKTGDEFDITSFQSFNSTHTEIVIGSIATKVKVGQGNPYFSEVEREYENKKTLPIEN